MTDVYLNCLRYIASLENIKLWANQCLIVNRIVRIREKYVKTFNYEKNKLRLV